MKIQRFTMLVVTISAWVLGLVSPEFVLGASIGESKLSLTYSVNTQNGLVLTPLDKSTVGNIPESWKKVTSFEKAYQVAAMCFTTYIADSAGRKRFVVVPASGRSNHDFDGFVFEKIPTNLTMNIDIKAKGNNKTMEHSINEPSATDANGAVKLMPCGATANDVRCKTPDDLVTYLKLSELSPAGGERICVNVIDAETYSIDGKTCPSPDGSRSTVPSQMSGDTDKESENGCGHVKLTCVSPQKTIYCAIGGGYAIACACRN